MALLSRNCVVGGQDDVVLGKFAQILGAVGAMIEVDLELSRNGVLLDLLLPIGQYRLRAYDQSAPSITLD